jgi:hypothetical protein
MSRQDDHFAHALEDMSLRRRYGNEYPDEDRIESVFMAEARAGRFQFSEGEYSGWSAEGEDDDGYGDEDLTFAQSTVGRRPDYGEGPGSDDSGYDGEDEEGDEHDDAEIDDRDGGNFANRPAANGYADIMQPNQTVIDGNYGDIVEAARQLATARHPGFRLEDLPPDEQQALLKQAVDMKGYMGDGNTRATAQQTPAVATPYDASPATLFRPEAYPNKQMAESAAWKQENKAVRLAKDAALQRYGKRFSELDQATKDQLLLDGAKRAGYQGDRRGAL